MAYGQFDNIKALSLTSVRSMSHKIKEMKNKKKRKEIAPEINLS